MLAGRSVGRDTSGKRDKARGMNAPEWSYSRVVEPVLVLVCPEEC